MDYKIRDAIKLAVARETSELIEQSNYNTMEQHERMILRHGKRSIISRCRECEKRIEKRNGLTFEYWKDKNGIDIKMIRSDGEGYIQLFNEDGDVFGCIMINKDSEDTAFAVQNLRGFAESMKWFMANN